MSWLNHQELMLVRGFEFVVGTFGSELLTEAIQTIDLMSGGNGITLAPDGWTPNIPATKSNAIWADSSVEDGRRLISAANGNVIETMALTIAASTVTELGVYMRVLQNYLKNVRDFWETPAEIEPCYLRWWANGAPGAQFALIYNIEAAYTYGDSETPLVDVVLTIEREPYWRAEVPPGDNPKRWTSFAAGEDYVDEPRNTNAPFLIPEADSLTTFQNMNEYNAGATAFDTQCYFDIPASVIPGDAPALMWWYSLEQNTTSTGLIAGVRSVNLELATANRPVYANTFNASDTSFTLGTDATRANDTGSVKAPGAATAQRVEVSFATATDQLRFTWGPDNLNKYVGKWAVYLRCRQVNGTAGQILMYLRYAQHPTIISTGVRMPTTSPQLLGTSGATATWGLSYMGVIDLPVSNSKTAQHLQGAGAADASNLNIGLYAQRTAGTGVLYFADLILIPIDEGAFQSLPINSSVSQRVMDTTGYNTRGLETDSLMDVLGSINTQGSNWTGRGFKLQPNKLNRVFFLMVSQDGLQSDVDYELGFYMQIVPRWSGIRDI